MSKVFGVFMSALLAVGISGCAVEPTRSTDDPATAQAGEPADTDSAPSTSTASDEILANCSIVQFCDASGSEGTRCIQQPGCTAIAATKECAQESRTVCGSPVAQWVMVTTNGVHHAAATSCGMSGTCGGQAPSGCFCDSACTSFGDCCFDGPC